MTAKPSCMVHHNVLKWAQFFGWYNFSSFQLITELSTSEYLWTIVKHTQSLKNTKEVYVMGAVISQTGEDLNVTNWPTFFSHGSFYCKSIFPESHLTVTWPCFTTRKYESPHLPYIFHLRKCPWSRGYTVFRQLLCLLTWNRWQFQKCDNKVYTCFAW